MLRLGGGVLAGRCWSVTPTALCRGPGFTERDACMAADDGAGHPDEAAEAATLGAGHAQEHAKIRAAAQALGGYSQLARIEGLNDLTRSQELANSKFHPKTYGQFADYFPSPDFAAHIAMLPTGKVLLFSFERVEADPTGPDAFTRRRFSTSCCPTSCDGVQRLAGRDAPCVCSIAHRRGGRPTRLAALPTACQYAAEGRGPTGGGSFDAAALRLLGGGVQARRGRSAAVQETTWSEQAGPGLFRRVAHLVQEGPQFLSPGIDRVDA